MTLSDLQTLCVDGFPTSGTRARLFDGFRRFHSLLTNAAISVDLWIDGSFLTEKIDPDDVDVGIKARHHTVLSWTQDQKGLLNWFIDDANEDAVYNLFSCECFFFQTYPDGRPSRETYWRDESFGVAFNSRQRKGIAVIELCDGASLRLGSHSASMPVRDLRTVGTARRL